MPFDHGLIRNHYVGRTFIEPKQNIRHFGVKIKLNPVREILEGKRVVVVDDSIVRGTTSRKIVSMVRSAGAREVHMRISSPPTVSPCYYGIDTPTRKELIASSHSVDEICTYIRADSLGYLSMEGLLKAAGKDTGLLPRLLHHAVSRAVPHAGRGAASSVCVWPTNGLAIPAGRVPMATNRKDPTNARSAWPASSSARSSVPQGEDRRGDQERRAVRGAGARVGRGAEVLREEHRPRSAGGNGLFRPGGGGHPGEGAGERRIEDLVATRRRWQVTRCPEDEDLLRAFSLTVVSLFVIDSPSHLR